MSGDGDSSWRYATRESAAAYRGRSPRRNRAEARLLASLLRDVDLGLTLDAPCGGGRLRPLLEERGARWVGLDLAGAMLHEAQAGGARALVRGRVDRLPFADGAFDTVICFRFLHHLAPDRQPEVVRELARVARRHLVVSAFHPFSVHGLRRRLRARGRPSRHPTAPAAIDGWLGPDLRPRDRHRQGWLRDLWVGLWSRA